MTSIAKKITAAAVCAVQLAACCMMSVPAAAAAADIRTDTIAVGTNHSLVIKSDLTLWAAGDNSCGQLGAGDTTTSSDGEKILTNIIAASANDNTSFAIDTNGNLYGWGENSNGQAVPGSSDSYIYKPTKVLENVMSVSAGATHTVALTTDGRLYGWGSNSCGELGFTKNGIRNDKTLLASGIVSAAAGDNFTVMVNNEGSLLSCGSNEYGQLGLNSTASVRAYVSTAMVSGAAMVAAGNQHILVLKTDGTVWAAGRNNCGQLGNDSDKNSASFVDTGLNNIKSIFAGGDSSGAVNTSGRLYSWGDNASGQLHNGKSTNQSEPSAVTTGVVSIAYGEHHSVMLRNNGNVSAVGEGSSGQLFYTSNSSVLKPEKVLSKITAIAAGSDHFVAINESGKAFTWGNNDCGQLGTGDFKMRSKPTQLSIGGTVTKVWAGNKVTFLQMEDGRVYCFGDNSKGLLGISSSEKRVCTPLMNIYLADTKNIEQICVGDGFCIALMDGSIYGWGSGGTGRLMDFTGFVENPRELDTSMIGKIKQIAVGDNHCFALSEAGQLYGWGGNSLKQLGMETEERYLSSPIEIEAKDKNDSAIMFSSIASAGAHSIGIATDGKLWVWGSNAYGQLGTSSSRIKAPTSIYRSAETVVAGAKACGIIDSKGYVLMSGDNRNGALGIGNTRSVSEFTDVDSYKVSQLAIGDGFGGYIDDNNDMFCWGDNTLGQVGNGKGGFEANPEIVFKDGLCKALVSATAVTLNKTEITLAPKSTQKLIATVTPGDAVNKSVSWSSSNENVAKVAADGTVTAVAGGTAVITAKTSNGITAKCNVTVAVKVTSFSISPSKSKTIAAGSSFTITAKIFPAAASDKTLLFESSDESVAKVDANGKVTGVAPGTAVIKVTAKSNTEKTRTLTVNVKPPKTKITYKKSTKSGIVLKWNESEGADGYAIYRRKGNGEYKLIAYTDELEFTDGTAKKGTSYYYYVKAYVGDEKKVFSSKSAAVKVTDKY
ncbi:MAG: Ig-like domain-containing protein [Oscillospiraceae bacterium]